MTILSTPIEQDITRSIIGNSIWLGMRSPNDKEKLATFPTYKIDYEVLESEEAIGQAMLEEIENAAQAKQGDLVIVLLGGRGAQALHRLLGQIAKTDAKDHLLSRLHVFTQDALATMRMNNGFSFVRDFERLLGKDFFKKVKSFTSFCTDTDDLEGEVENYIEKLLSLGDIDIFFLGLGPEANDASHLAYIKPNSGARLSDVAGLIPISQSILEHHIAKFKAGGSLTNEADEEECRRATHILTLGPAAIFKARRVVQSIVDASTSPAKRACYRRVLNEEISNNPVERETQLDENPGLWLRLHPNVRSLILPDVLSA
jgi:6-phosphogluconolactonase/glucosamine-6-phosphate isomerase/deaminase